MGRIDAKLLWNFASVIVWPIAVIGLLLDVSALPSVNAARRKPAQGRASGPLAATHTYSASPALGIPSGANVSSPMSVPDSFLVGDLNVGINVSHRLRGDLEISLCSPTGDCLQLHSYMGGSPGDLDVMFDDESIDYPTIDISAPGGSNHDVSPPYYEYIWHPAGGDLRVFDGLQANGTWTLKIHDVDTPPPTNGVLNRWSLNFVEPGPRLDDSSMRVESSPTVAGKTVKYTLTLKNTNYPPTTATHVTDTLPTTLTLKSGTAASSSGVVTENGTGIEWNGQIGTAQPEWIAFEVQVNASAGGTTVVNTASLTDPSFPTALQLSSNLTVAASFLRADDFELNDGGYTPGGSSSSWAWGAPTSGPASAHSGTLAWATNLGGDYNYQENSYLTSPPINLTASGIPSPLLQLSWWQWLWTLPDVYDHGQLEVRGGGVDWKVLYGPVSGAVDREWKQHTVDISSFANASDFQFRFHLDTLDYHFRRPGWYVDDINVAAILSTGPYVLPILDGSDFNHDLKSDVAVWRPSTGQWLLKDQGSPFYGKSGDIPASGDYNGDGVTDIALWRPSTGRWYIMDQSSVSWGRSGDIPVPGHYGVTRQTDIAVWRPSTGTWYIKDRPSVTWGRVGDIPVPANYDGDPETDVAIWRPSTGKWYVQGRSNATWGKAGDIPVPGDYNGDGTAEIAVWRPSSGVWYIQGQASTSWGKAQDIPVPGDYNGDGKADVAVWRPSNGTWYIKDQSTVSWGQKGDFPLVR